MAPAPLPNKNYHGLKSAEQATRSAPAFLSKSDLEENSKFHLANTQKNAIFEFCRNKGYETLPTLGQLADRGHTKAFFHKVWPHAVDGSVGNILSKKIEEWLVRHKQEYPDRRWEEIWFTMSGRKIFGQEQTGESSRRNETTLQQVRTATGIKELTKTHHGDTIASPSYGLLENATASQQQAPIDARDVVAPSQSAASAGTVGGPMYPTFGPSVSISGSSIGTSLPLPSGSSSSVPGFTRKAVFSAGEHLQNVKYPENHAPTIPKSESLSHRVARESLTGLAATQPALDKGDYGHSPEEITYPLTEDLQPSSTGHVDFKQPLRRERRSIIDKPSQPREHASDSVNWHTDDQMGNGEVLTALQPKQGLIGNDKGTADEGIMDDEEWETLLKQQVARFHDLGIGGDVDGLGTIEDFVKNMARGQDE